MENTKHSLHSSRPNFLSTTQHIVKAQSTQTQHTQLVAYFGLLRFDSLIPIAQFKARAMCQSCPLLSIYIYRFFVGHWIRAQCARNLKYSTTSSSSQHGGVQSRRMEGVGIARDHALDNIMYNENIAYIYIYICSQSGGCARWQRLFESGKAHLLGCQWLDTGKDEPAPCLVFVVV